LSVTLKPKLYDGSASRFNPRTVEIIPLKEQKG